MTKRGTPEAKSFCAQGMSFRCSIRVAGTGRCVAKIAVAALDGAAHQDHALELAKRGQIFVDGGADIHQGSDGDQRNLARVAANLFQDEAHCVGMRWLRIVAAFGVAALGERAFTHGGRTCCHGNFRAAHFGKEAIDKLCAGFGISERVVTPRICSSGLRKASASAKASSTSSPMSVSMITFSGSTLLGGAGVGEGWPQLMGKAMKMAQPRMQVRIAEDLAISDRLSSNGYRAGCDGLSGKGMSLSRGRSKKGARWCGRAQAVFENKLTRQLFSRTRFMGFRVGCAWVNRLFCSSNVNYPYCHTARERVLFANLCWGLAQQTHLASQRFGFCRQAREPGGSTCDEFQRI